MDYSVIGIGDSAVACTTAGIVAAAGDMRATGIVGSSVACPMTSDLARGPPCLVSPSASLLPGRLSAGAGQGGTGLGMGVYC